MSDDLWLWPMWHLTLTMWHLILTHVTFDLDPRDLWPPSHLSNTLCKIHKNRIFALVTLTFDLDLHTWPRYSQCSSPYQIWWLYLKHFRRYELLSRNFGLVTDRHMDRQKPRHMSPPCISTGGLKNGVTGWVVTTCSNTTCLCLKCIEENNLAYNNRSRAPLGQNKGGTNIVLLVRLRAFWRYLTCPCWSV